MTPEEQEHMVQNVRKYNKAKPTAEDIARGSKPPPRRAAPTLRSITPATVSLSDVRRVNVVKARLVHALNTCDTLALLRESLVELACDLGELPAGAALDPAPDEHEAVTERMLAPFNDEQPPSIEVDSDVGREYGGG